MPLPSTSTHPLVSKLFRPFFPAAGHAATPWPVPDSGRRLARMQIVAGNGLAYSLTQSLPHLLRQADLAPLPLSLSQKNTVEGHKPKGEQKNCDRNLWGCTISCQPAHQICRKFCLCWFLEASGWIRRGSFTAQRDKVIKSLRPRYCVVGKREHSTAQKPRGLFTLHDCWTTAGMQTAPRAHSSAPHKVPTHLPQTQL